MDQQSINEAYKKFGVPQEQIPDYTDPDNFSKDFKICSVLSDNNITYSSNSGQNNLEGKER